MEEKEEVFYVGLCMAGAVSAGAYTAGVIDYLTEALEKYEAYRIANANTPGAPKHKVEIPVIGGASAGGMTGVITTAALQNQNFQHVTSPGGQSLEKHPENGLYHSWVDLVDDNMFPVMLGNADINNTKEVDSLLNSDFIETIASRMLTPSENVTWKDLPSYFSKKLKVFVTLSNLQGFSYNVAFKAAQSGNEHPYYMQIHNDYGCFQIVPDDNYNVDEGWIAMNLKKGLNANIAMNAAMATGAFPVGLKARTLTRPGAVLNKNQFLATYLEHDPLPDGPYESLNIDGGMINNEPFDTVRAVLNDVTRQDQHIDYENYQKFKSTVVMVAPFPSVKPSNITIGEKLLHVIGLTLPAMISQMRAKPAQLVNAWDPECAGQFLVDPSRTNGSCKIQGDRAIACGALGGFSGFLSKDFRVHDFFLGRYNCYIFLRDYFTIKEEDARVNPIFKASFGDPNDETKRFLGKTGYQIIPIIEDAPPAEPKWPVQKRDIFNRFSGPLRRRTSKILLNISDLKWYWKLFLTIVLYLGLRRFLSGKVLDNIKKQLTDWGLIKN